MTTTVYFLLDGAGDTPITDIQYYGYPHFEKGDTVSLQVNNNLPEKWDVEPMGYTEYEVVRRHHDALKYYGSSVNFQISLHVYLKPKSE